MIYCTSAALWDYERGGGIFLQSDKDNALLQLHYNSVGVVKALHAQELLTVKSFRLLSQDKCNQLYERYSDKNMQIVRFQ